MRKIYFLFPEMKLNRGGHLTQVKLFEIAKQICPSEVATYDIQEDGILFIGYKSKTRT